MRLADELEGHELTTMLISISQIEQERGINLFREVINASGSEDFYVLANDFAGGDLGNIVKSISASNPEVAGDLLTTLVGAELLGEFAARFNERELSLLENLLGIDVKGLGTASA